VACNCWLLKAPLLGTGSAFAGFGLTGWPVMLPLGGPGPACLSPGGAASVPGNFDYFYPGGVSKGKRVALKPRGRGFETHGWRSLSLSLFHRGQAYSHGSL
jgi:hypothetical protein